MPLYVVNLQLSMASIEGRVENRGPNTSARLREVYGINPTELNNVETWANIPVIISEGAKSLSLWD